MSPGVTGMCTAKSVSLGAVGKPSPNRALVHISRPESQRSIYGQGEEGVIPFGGPIG